MKKTPKWVSEIDAIANAMMTPELLKEMSKNIGKGTKGMTAKDSMWYGQKGCVRSK
jgi:hypothetical protein